MEYSRAYRHSSLLESGYECEVSSFLLTKKSHSCTILKYRLREDRGKGHMYSSVLNNSEVESFVNEMIIPGDGRVRSDAFTLTVTIPAESGPLHGWSIEQLRTPGRCATVSSNFFSARLNIWISRVGRLHVRAINNRRIRVETCNVQIFQLSASVLKKSCASYELNVDDSMLIITQVDDVARFYTTEPGKWQVSDQYADCTPGSWAG